MDGLSIDIDMAAIAIMESLGVVALLMAFLFYRQLRRINDKQRAILDAQKRRVISERADGKCYSYEWVMDNVVYKPRKLLKATPFLLTTVSFLVAVYYYSIGPYIFVNVFRLGYAVLIALIGIAILVRTEAFEAYSYTNAIRKVATEQLDKEDQSYMELAGEALAKAFLRFVSLGVVFALLGPFIPQIFNGVVYAFLFYMSIVFQATETTLKVTQLLGIIVALTLPVFMLLLPELLGRVTIYMGKSLTRKLIKRRVK